MLFADASVSSVGTADNLLTRPVGRHPDAARRRVRPLALRRRALNLRSNSTGQQFVGNCNYCPAFLDQGLCSPRRFLQGLGCAAHHAERHRTASVGAQYDRSAMRGEVERHGSLLFCSGGSGLWALSAGNAWGCVLPIQKTTTPEVCAPPGWARPLWVT
jgi:hypothetical protein